MMVVIQIASQAVVTVIAVLGLALKLEHRLTKIETNLSWLINNAKCGCAEEQENEDGS